MRTVSGRLAAPAVGLAALFLAARGGPTSPTTPTPPSDPTTHYNVSGSVFDALTGSPVGWVSIYLNEQVFEKAAESGANGAFAGTVTSPAEVRIYTSHPDYVSHITYMRVTDPPKTISLIPASFSLGVFDDALARDVHGLGIVR